MSRTTASRLLPPLTARQQAAVDTAGTDGRRYAHKIIGNHERGIRVDPAELLYARQILAYWASLQEASDMGRHLQPNGRPSRGLPPTSIPFVPRHMLGR